ncbi:MAG: Mitochondrial presequence protease [Peltula sp. TS41687]|nr:MAG: Mitochondrial presequence protease [Peltula sp. TS41687]
MGKLATRWASLRLKGGRPYATITNLEDLPKPGEKIHGFTLKRTKEVPELELTALQLEHDRTGAEYLHIARDDRNNVFSIGFKTNPPDDTGVPHILEHTTLCGSQRYPVRDPFFKMLRRSLSNFMNAFTSSDNTMYPFATTNQQDFYNLMSVYLDATLHPLLRETDFAQEGWRIGPENPSLPGAVPGLSHENDRLVFKGVVYNEMKGQMSDASYLYSVKFQKHVMPSINNSGGDPQRITDLTHEQLKSFHHDHYHPSNAKVFTYGNMPLREHLKQIDAQFQAFEKIKADKDIKQPISLEDGPHYITEEGPTDPLLDPSTQYKTSTTWLTGDTSDILESFSLGIISSLLLVGYGSPLYRNLIEAGLGLDWSPNTGFDGSGKVGIFSIGLTGVKQVDLSRVKETIDKTLVEVHSKGFDKSKVDGILHQLDLALRHKTAHFGMSLMHRLKPAWFNGVDPVEAIAWNEIVLRFRKRFSEDRYLESLLERYLLNNNTLTFTMTPSASYGKALAQEEASRLASKIEDVKKEVGDEAKVHEGLRNKEIELLKKQEKARNEDLSCLPSLHLADIPRQKETKTFRDAELDNISVQWREAPTSGLTYFRAVNRLPNLPDELRMYVPLYTDSIMRLGTRHKTMEQIEDLIKLKTGGIRVGYSTTTSPTDIYNCNEGLGFSGYALDQNVPVLYELLQTIAHDTKFDGPEAEAMIRELIQSAASNAVDSIAESGHGYARGFAEAGLTPQGRFGEETSGLTQVRLIADLASRASTDGLEDVIDKLKMIQKIALTSSKAMRVAITCGPESVKTNENHLGKFLGDLPTAKGLPDLGLQSDRALPKKTIFRLPYQVYYTGLAVPTVPYTDPAGASIQILAHLLTHKHLHHEIREKGGAYGGGAYARGLGGVFGFYSYRDPNPQNTIKTISSAGVWARDNHWSDQDMEEAKLSVFQSIDAPESVSEEGMTRFLHGIDGNMEQRRREQLLDVTAQDVQSAAHKFLVEGMEKSRLAVIGEAKEWVKQEEGWVVSDIGVTPSEPEQGDQ